MAYNIKSIKKEFAEKGIFYTEPELANYLKSFLPDGVKEVYDPTCGNGGLLSVFDDDVEKYGQEINAEQLADAEKHLKNFHGICGDTLKNPAWMDRKFDYIVANPPFGIKWEPPKMDMFDRDPRFESVPVLPSRGMADFAFMLHILYMLSDKGTAVVLDSLAINFRDNAEGKIRQWMLENNYIEKVIYIPENQFVDTKIKTCIWVLSKHKENNEIIFIDKKTGKQAVFTIDDVRKKNFKLDANSYFPQEKAPELPKVPVLLKQIHDDVGGQLKAVVELTRQLGNEDCFEIFIEEIQGILDNAKTYYGSIGDGISA